jgi:hypothetical protein
MAAEESPLERLARALCEDVLKHAQVFSGEPRDAAALEAIDRLRRSAWAYVDALLTLTSWGNPFGRLEDEAGESKAARGEDARGRAKGRVARVDAEYRVRLKDPARLARAATDRAARAQAGCEDVSHPLDALGTLFEIDGWDPAQYGDALEVLDSSSRFSWEKT